MLSREIGEREVAEVMPVGWIGEGVGRRKMGYGDLQHGAGCANAINLVHDFDDVIEVFDNVEASNQVERLVAEWPGCVVQIDDNIGFSHGNPIDVYTIRKMLPPATEIQRAEIWLVSRDGRIPERNDMMDKRFKTTIQVFDLGDCNTLCSDSRLRNID